ncbi:protein HEG homolog 1 [Toxorhynchites rutilus septentrionalis]|uniref:protein HEG homolog 1 n=1 Tax=Toxorhynchites rutilus septentrionalis TaxID=329112 RepID=UPI002479FEDF|nr:protein HEG homolog 1 [Toxorhynchites rutilus septentrionalis]XP_055630469.1 protein HEG homolog 1 [Toxorhynchites rutilus septentrionalis]
MGKMQNKLFLAVIVVISVIACQATQRSDSDNSENLSQHSSKQLAHRHHNQHHQHKLSSVSLGGRNSSRYSLIGSGNNYHQIAHGYHHHQTPNEGQQAHNWYPRSPGPTHQNRRSNHPGHPRWKPTTASTTNPRTNQPGGNTVGVRHVKRMLKHNNHNRNVTGKNVCSEKRTVHVPIYRKSTVKHYIQPCLDQKLCTEIRANYEPTYHPVKREVYVCCAGWETSTTIADGCHNPICRSQCRNGGRCTAPDTCSCPAGYAGSLCEQDINECKIDKPCDQTCYNTEGSYYCTCREGFILQPDRQSCKKIDTTNDVATEAKDMESDVDYDSLDTRLTKLEKIILNEDRRSLSETHELSQKVQYALDAISSLRSQVSRLTQRLYPTVDYENRIN